MYEINGKTKREFVMRNLGYKIEYLRRRMHEIALEKGISHPDVLRISQMLDEAINEFYDVGLIKKYG